MFPVPPPAAPPFCWMFLSLHEALLLLLLLGQSCSCTPPPAISELSLAPPRMLGQSSRSVPSTITFPQP